MHTKEVCSLVNSVGKESQCSRISFSGVLQYREPHRCTVFLEIRKEEGEAEMDELIQFSQQEKIIFLLFREIETGVENDLFSA